MLSLRPEDAALIKDISLFFKEMSLERPFLVGGVVRDYFLKREYKDIDITNNTGGQSFIGGLFYARLREKNFKISNKGYVTIYSKDHSNVDFSSGMKSSVADDLNETESRNFTINSILYDIDNNKVIDEFGGVDDINAKVIRTILPPDMAFKENENRVIKCLELATKLDFNIDEEIVKFYKENKDYLSYCISRNKNYVFNSLSPLMRNKPQVFLNNLFKLDMFTEIPLAGEYKSLLIKSKLLQRYMDESR